MKQFSPTPPPCWFILISKKTTGSILICFFVCFVLRQKKSIHEGDMTITKNTGQKCDAIRWIMRKTLVGSHGLRCLRVNCDTKTCHKYLNDLKHKQQTLSQFKRYHAKLHLIFSTNLVIFVQATIWKLHGIHFKTSGRWSTGRLHPYHIIFWCISFFFIS